LLTSVWGQVGGTQSYSVLQIPANAKLAALGGTNVSDRYEVNNIMENPALMDSVTLMQGSVSYLDYLADIQMSQLAYATKIGKTEGIWFAGIRYFNLGVIDQTDEIGNVLGSFKSREYTVTVGHSRRAGNFSFGANIKVLGSNIVNVTSGALLFDLGGTFIHPTADFTAGLVISNLGFVFDRYTEAGEIDIPWDVRAGVTFKPQYMPFRFSLTAHSLVNGDLLYYNQGNNLSGDEPSVMDRALAHVAIGMEVVIHRNFSALIGYNHQRRKELRLPSTSGGAGLSFGARLAVKSFALTYARTQYHVAGGSNTFTITADFNRLIKRN